MVQGAASLAESAPLRQNSTGDADLKDRLRKSEMKLFEMTKAHADAIRLKDVLIQEMSELAADYRQKIEDLQTQNSVLTSDNLKLAHRVDDLSMQIKMLQSQLKVQSDLQLTLEHIR